MPPARDISGPDAAAGVPIADQRSLLALSRDLRDAELIAVDTEFVREKTYYPELCLIQVASEKVIACVDCLAGLDPEPLLDALLRPGCAWVLHSARQDLEVIWNAAQRLPGRLIDTQIAAALLGFAPQLSLQSLLTELLGVELDKSHARSDWTRRPLPRKALDYAIDDVRYLLPAWSELSGRLEARGRLDWHAEDCRRALGTPLAADTHAIWLKLRGIAAMTDDQRAAALGLVRWREKQAQRRNRPRRWILSDEPLTQIAKALPGTPEELAAVGDLPRRLLAHSGTEILDAIKKSRKPSIRAAVAAFQPPSKPDKARLAMLQRRVADLARELGIEPELLATRRDLVALANGDVPETLTSGWRAEQLRVDELIG